MFMLAECAAKSKWRLQKDVLTTEATENTEYTTGTTKEEDCDRG